MSLLLYRYRKQGNITDLIIGIILFVACYQRITYTVGFMSWYDTFRNTKINYFLIPTGLLLGPLLYFYVKSIISVNWRFKRRDFYHFIPFLIYFLFRVSIWLYDMGQLGYADTQNGAMMQYLNMSVVGAIFILLENISMILYLAFTIQSYYLYRGRIKQYYSNTYDLELNWLRNFLLIYTFLHAYGLVQATLNNGILEMSYIHKWWLEFLYALAIIYIGIKGYFTPVSKLQEVSFSSIPEFEDYQSREIEADNSYDVSRVIDAMEIKQLYLNPDLTLGDLAKELKMSTSDLSETINAGLGMNFNDFINSYRVDAVKQALIVGKQSNMSLMGIAYDCGFNSKATFNRVFKKMTGNSPSNFINNQN